MRALLAEVDNARPAFLALADRDAESFEAVMQAFAMPRADDRQRAERSAAIQRAYESAARVPLEVARRAVALLYAARTATELGNANAASDGLSAAHALHAATHSALANVAINAAGLKDETVAAELGDELGSRADELLAATRRAFAGRVS
jgi:formiminotetrahydrofolate cyclodeaminase